MLENSSLTNDEIAIQESYKSLKMIGNDYANQKSHKLSSIRHDIEQAKYLLTKGFKDTRIIDFASNGETFLNYLRSKNKNNNTSMHQAIMDKPLNEIKNILQKYWSLPIIYNTKEIKNFLNPNNNWKNIQEKYIDSKPEFVVIDNFLSEEALIELRKFCLLSKVFLKEYENDYLGAFGNMGFTSQIHIGIGRDLKARMSKIFGNQSLNHMWAFKYDSKIGSGINVHADFAKVNLNFWITPDKYNLNTKSGGLKVYDTPPPEDWVFEKYNASQKDIYKFLENVNKLIVITGKGIHSNNENDPYVSKNLGILKHSVPEFILKNESLMRVINEITDAKIEDGGSGAFYIYLKRNKNI